MDCMWRTDCEICGSVDPNALDSKGLLRILSREKDPGTKNRTGAGHRRETSLLQKGWKGRQPAGSAGPRVRAALRGSSRPSGLVGPGRAGARRIWGGPRLRHASGLLSHLLRSAAPAAWTVQPRRGALSPRAFAPNAKGQIGPRIPGNSRSSPPGRPPPRPSRGPGSPGRELWLENVPRLCPQRRSRPPPA
ncbi:protein SPT2 homolog [Ailuropoda melanoleuca]|uniref:protein SPT2 homolog n=1 Tax=Ailuropoda melanoleuca TaxID=9646 RepID=UPI0014948167|nr:protein SPT2 homolog [Ailuropoda melanoleuca]